MADILLFLLISIGCSSLWSLSDVFMKSRNIVAKHFPNPIKKMLLCMECSAFWIGVVVSVVFLPIFANPNIIFANNIASGVCTYLVVKLLNKYNVF